MEYLHIHRDYKGVWQFRPCHDIHDAIYHVQQEGGFIVKLVELTDAK